MQEIIPSIKNSVFVDFCLWRTQQCMTNHSEEIEQTHNTRSKTINFNEQLYTFHAYGFAQDPTDFSKDKIIGDKDRYNSQDTSKSVFTGSNYREKNYKKQLKMRRMKYGDPATGEFMGPWAIYEGEEIFKNMSGELTEEQKEILKQMEEKRLKKIEDDKSMEPKVLNVRITIILVPTNFNFPFATRF